MNEYYAYNGNLLKFEPAGYTGRYMYDVINGTIVTEDQFPIVLPKAIEVDNPHLFLRVKKVELEKRIRDAELERFEVETQYAYDEVNVRLGDLYEELREVEYYLENK